MGKILTIEDLVSFCESNNMRSFSSSESGYKLHVRVPSTFETTESTDSMLYVRVKLLHTNRNRNGSNVTEKAARACMSSIKYKPLLANFMEDEDGVKDFTSHDMIIQDGELIYIEKQVGCFTADKPSLEYDEDKDRYYLYANAAIPREYTPAAEIIERKNGTKVSCELCVNEMEFNAKEKELVLNDIEIIGCTLLGKNPETGEEVQEGMEGARADIQDFNVKLQFEQNNKLVEVLEKLNESLSFFNIKNSKKGGNNQVKFEELLEKYGKTVEDVTFDYSEMSDDELELAFKELFDLTDGGQSEGSENSDDPKDTTGDSDDADDDETDDTEDSEDESNNEDPDDFPKKKVEYSVTVEETTKNFSISLSDKIYALQTLVNDTYSESDNDWYYVDVFEEEKYVVMHGWTKNYRQSFKVRNDVYSLVGDRVEVFAQYLTQDEIKKMDEMRSNYSSISDKLSKYESEPEKMEILESDDYKAIYDTAEYEALLEKDAHFDLTTEEVRAKADEILLSYAKAGNLNFSAEEDKKVGKKTFAKKNKSGRYGSIFAK